ncbi:MAG: deoxyribose-phosphate aldolase [Planctomycetota bacterium]|nr:deoxyribose-phosphate aldolase [Planctomycetota bacterium]MDA1105381.1 deoxyribose-phosphate aldolase [Planctomycetota bacterium]
MDAARHLGAVTVDDVTVVRRAAHFTTRSIKKDSKSRAIRLAVSMVDLTTLEGADTAEKVRSLCVKAAQPCTEPLHDPLPACAAVCVYPQMVRAAKECLRLLATRLPAAAAIKVASVATGFPSGQYSLDLRVRDTHEAVAAGADEIDMVISRGAFLSGDLGFVRDEVRAIREACGSAHLKIILETGELATLDNVRRASDMAIDAAVSAPGCAAPHDGDLFIKTSTGKVQPAATMPVTLVMLEAIRDHFRATGLRIGMKPAGGIRTSKQAIHYLVMVRETLGEAWLSPHLFRFGASALLGDLVRQALWMERGVYTGAGDSAEP